MSSSFMIAVEGCGSFECQVSRGLSHEQARWQTSQYLRRLANRHGDGSSEKRTFYSRYRTPCSMPQNARRPLPLVIYTRIVVRE